MKLSSMYSEIWNIWLRSEQVESVESARSSVILGSDVRMRSFSNVSVRENVDDEDEEEVIVCSLGWGLSVPSRLSIEMSLSGSVGGGGIDDRVVDARGMIIPLEQRFRTKGQRIAEPSDNSRLNSSSLVASTRKIEEKFFQYEPIWYRDEGELKSSVNKTSDDYISDALRSSSDRQKEYLES